MNQVSHSNRSKVLITGINGFTGRYLAAELERSGMLVYGTTRGETNPDITNIYSVDLLNYETVRRILKEIEPDYIIHLAAISFVGHSNVNSIYEANVLGTRNLLSALTKINHKPRKVVLASSANVYGNSENSQLVEESPLQPANDYAVSKVSMEYMSKLWEDQLPIVRVRPFNYTGPGQDDRFLIPKIVKHFKEGRPKIELGNIAVARDFSDVRSVVDSYAKILLAKLQSDTVNICSGKTYSLSNLIDMMADIAGYQIKVVVNPSFVRANDVMKLGGSKHKLESVIGSVKDIDLYTTLSDMFFQD